MSKAIMDDIIIARSKERSTFRSWTIRLHRSEEHTSELQSLMRISYAVFCLKKKKTIKNSHKGFAMHRLITAMLQVNAHGWKIDFENLKLPQDRTTYDPDNPNSCRYYVFDHTRPVMVDQGR